MKKMIVSALAVLSSPALAAGLPFSRVSCGDHWFEVRADIDGEAMTATVSLSGDGVEDDATYAATVSDEGDIVLTLTGTDDALIIDDSDAVHDLFWGTYRSGTHESSLGLCQVD